MNYAWWEPFEIKGLVKGRIFKTGWTYPVRTHCFCGFDHIKVKWAETHEIIASLK